MLEHLLERLRFGDELVERELRVGDVVEALGLGDVEAPLEKMELLEDLVIARTQARERIMGPRELAAQ